MDIKGKTIIVTGATGKLTREIVISLAKSGANCVCLYHENALQAKTLKAFLDKSNIQNLFIKADLTKQTEIEKVFSQIRKFSIPQVLINSASVFDKKPLNEIATDYIQQIFEINFTAAMMMTQKFVEFAGRKIKQKTKPFAKIINITDAAIERPPAGYSVYSASKAALDCATVTLAKELAPGITVNAVAPGIISWQKGFAEHKKRRILSRIPMHRAGLAEEIADAVKFLIQNDYVTGSTLSIDGGWTL